MCILYFSTNFKDRKEATAQGSILKARESRVQGQQQQLQREFDTSLNYKISYLKEEKEERERGKEGREEGKREDPIYQTKCRVG